MTMKKDTKQTFYIRFLTIGKICIFFSLFSFFLISCEDVINVNLNDEELNLIAVEAEITTQTQPTVYLYKTLAVDQTLTYPIISGATVVFTDNASPANQVTLTEDKSNLGHYQVPGGKEYLGVVGREYTLSIQTESVTITASEKITKVATLDSVTITPSILDDQFLAASIYTQETKGLGNYYKWDTYVNDTLLGDTKNLSIAKDKYVDGNYISKLEVYPGDYETSSNDDRKFKLNDTIQVKQTSISEFVYYYYSQVISQNSSGSMFSNPPTNIKSNFTSSDGKTVLGLFVARDISASKKIVITQEIEDQIK
jgi:hypothetical protein